MAEGADNGVFLPPPRQPTENVVVEDEVDTSDATGGGESSPHYRYPKRRPVVGRPRPLIHSDVASLSSITTIGSVNLTEKYDGNVNPIEFLQIYTTIIEVVGGDDRVMANFFPMTLKGQVRAWLMNFLATSIHSWEDLWQQFIMNFQGTYPCSKEEADLHTVQCQDDESLRQYIQRRKTRVNIAKATMTGHHRFIHRKEGKMSGRKIINYKTIAWQEQEEALSVGRVRSFDVGVGPPVLWVIVFTIPAATGGLRSAWRHEEAQGKPRLRPLDASDDLAHSLLHKGPNSLDVPTSGEFVQGDEGVQRRVASPGCHRSWLQGCLQLPLLPLNDGLVTADQRLLRPPDPDLAAGDLRFPTGEGHGMAHGPDVAKRGTFLVGCPSMGSSQSWQQQLLRYSTPLLRAELSGLLLQGSELSLVPRDGLLLLRHVNLGLLVGVDGRAVGGQQALLHRLQQIHAILKASRSSSISHITASSCHS
uniref:Retrotransposon gag domain-containing protein n=1 Tax=Oryza brachyantha TaxID=4533 RepID=J3KVE4_ORYBR